MNNQKKSPNAFFSNQTNQQTIDNIIKLTNSVEEKRKQLNQIYYDIQKNENQNPELIDKSNKNDILKHVHFESIDTTQEDFKIQKIMNSTFTVDIKNILKEKDAKNQINTKVTGDNSKNNSKTKNPDKSLFKTIKISPAKIETHQKSSPTKRITRQVLTYQQKKQLEKENKVILDKKIEELRQKVIVRKFGYIWLRYYLFPKDKILNSRTILPSQVEKYYQNRLLKTILNLWHNDIRFQRNEWRLNVKAECHYNYILLNKIWTQWRDYLVEYKYEKKLEKIAMDHFKANVIRKLFEQWKCFKLEVRRKKHMLENVQRKRNHEILKETFDIWFIKYFGQKKRDKLEEIAERHYMLVTLSKSYAIWNFKLLHEKEERRKIRLANQFYRENLIRKHLLAIKMFTLYRRKKKVQKQKLDEYAVSQLVYRVYQTWVQKLEIRTKLNDLEKEIVDFKQTYMKIRVISYLKQVFFDRNRIRQLDIKAKKFYDKKLKKKALLALKANHSEIKREQLISEKAVKFDILWSKKIAFYKWIDKLENKNEIKSMHLVFKARKHYENYLLTTGFKTWTYFIKQKRKLNVKEKIADDFHNKVLAKKYFNSIVNYVQITKQKRKNHSLAEEFYKINSSTKYFTYWSKKYEQTIELQMNLRIAILHHESSVQSKIFLLWFDKYQSKIKDEINENRADFWNRRYLLQKYLKVLINLNRENKCEQDNNKKALVFSNQRLCLPVFKSWKKFIEQRRLFYQKCDDMDNFYKAKMFKKCFGIWIDRTKEFKKVNQTVNQMFNEKQIERCNELFSNWKRHVELKKLEKKNEEIAITFYLRHLMIKIIDEWRDYSSNRALKRYNQKIKIENFQTIQSQLIKRHVFSNWKEKSLQIIAEEHKEHIATNFYNRKLMLKYLIGWKVYHKFCLQKKLMNNQAKLFFNMRLKSEYYFKWCLRYQQECELRDKNEKALLLWSINIQKNCFTAWQTWINMKKKKQKRYKEALEIRQLDILKECSRKFLKYSMDSKIRRLQASRFLKEKYLSNSVELEAKYFNIWLNKCKFKTLPNREEKKIIKLDNSVLDIKAKKTKILQDISCDKKEKISGPQGPTIKMEVQSKSRPAPRKPNFLIESLDVSKVVKIQENENIVETILLPNSEIIIEEPKIKTSREVVVNTVLLPPSAFLTAPETPQLISPSSVISENKHQIFRNQIKSVSMSTISNEEVYKELNYKKTNSKSNLVTTVSSSAASLDDESKKKSSNNDMELVELKKRLESYSIKSDKLKRLKEQEKLLLNCIKSNEISQTSMCETIYQEKEQVQREIQEMTKFLKTEKPILNELLKKYNLA